MTKILNRFKGDHWPKIGMEGLKCTTPHTVVKDILNQDPDGKRDKWISVILEYDLEIKPTKLIKG